MKHADFDTNITPIVPEAEILALFQPKPQPIFDLKCAKATREVRGKLRRNARRKAIAMKHSWLNNTAP